MSSASLNLPCMLLRLVEVHAFFSITYADNHTNLRNNMATEALNTLQIYVVIFCLVLTGHCAGTAAAFGFIFTRDTDFTAAGIGKGLGSKWSTGWPVCACLPQIYFLLLCGLLLFLSFFYYIVHINTSVLLNSLLFLFSLAGIWLLF